MIEIASIKKHTWLDLVTLLVQRAPRVRYQGSNRSYFWSMLDPLLYMTIPTLIFSKIVLIKMDSFAIFILSGISGSMGVQFYHELMARKLEEAKPQHVRDEEKRKWELIENDAIGKSFGEAILRKVILKNSNGRSALRTGYDTILSIEFEIVHELVADPCIGFAIHTTDQRDLRILGGNTRILNTISSPAGFRKPNIYTTTFNLKFRNLASGSFKLIKAIHSLALDRTIDNNSNALNFDIGSAKYPNNFDKDLVAAHLLFNQVEVANQYHH